LPTLPAVPLPAALDRHRFHVLTVAGLLARLACRGLLRPRLPLLGLAAVTLLAALLVAAVELGAERAIHPERQDATAGLAAYPFAAMTQSVRFPSADGTPLAGWFISGQPRGATIILLPGYGQSRADMLPQAAYLHQAGYNVLLFDFRGTGESGGAAFTFGIKEPLDVRGAVAYLESRRDIDHNRIAVQGVSVGASIGLLAAAGEPRLRAAVAESAFDDLQAMIASDFHRYSGLPAFPFATITVAVMQPRLGGSVDSVRPVDAVARLGDRPVFIISDGQDQVLPPGSGRQLYAAASGPKQLWLVPTAPHAAGYLAEPTEYARRVLAFYGQYLAGPGTPPGAERS
jgi:fermentation-respiration switch protein FrsA (DUF1100 family)